MQRNLPRPPHPPARAESASGRYASAGPPTRARRIGAQDGGGRVLVIAYIAVRLEPVGRAAVLADIGLVADLPIADAGAAVLIMLHQVVDQSFPLRPAIRLHDVLIDRIQQPGLEADRHQRLGAGLENQVDVAVELVEIDICRARAAGRNTPAGKSGSAGDAARGPRSFALAHIGSGRGRLAPAPCARYPACPTVSPKSTCTVAVRGCAASRASPKRSARINVRKLIRSPKCPACPDGSSPRSSLPECAAGACLPPCSFTCRSASMVDAGVVNG